MKIALGVGYYYPDSIGGTEKYVHDLTIYLLQQGIEVFIIAPSFERYNEQNQNYHYTHQDKQNLENSYEVYRFGVPKELTHEEITDKVICRGHENFEKLLMELKPDIFHLHTLSTPLNYRHLKIAKEKGIKTLFTAHIPGVICPKGDFIKYPKKVCDGKLTHSNCGYCHAQWRHKNKAVAEITGKLAQSSFASTLLEKKIPQFSVVSQKKNTLRELEKNTTYIIAVCQWLYDGFLINGVSQNQLKICRQGVSVDYSIFPKEKSQFIAHQDTRIKNTNSRLKIGFIGRLEPIKGLDILLNAFEKAKLAKPDLEIELHVVGVKQDFYIDYYIDLQKKMQSLPHVYYQESLPAEKISNFISKLDYLCIPSVWLETGPIVAYEAFANQVPIIGANMGGIAELVEDRKTGLLYQFNELNSLKDILLEVNNNPTLVSLLRQNINYPRTTKEVGEEMLTIYDSLIKLDKKVEKK